MSDLRDHRRKYESHSIDSNNLHVDPVKQFGQWLQEAIDFGALDATSMTLATATLNGIPSARIVLLKHYDDQGFCWYSDSRSQKGQELASNPEAALLFHWRDLNRQIRVQGRVENLAEEVAESYFHSRPDGSRFSAAASQQSAPIANRAALELRVNQLRNQYPEGDVPRPGDWIGYRLKPTYFEFWQGLSNRLHDRLVYRPKGDAWSIERIQP